MDRIKFYLCSSIGRKQIMALTGLGLSLFVLSHMLGNLLLFCGPDTYNAYAHSLTSNPFIYVAEAGLLTIFLVHITFAIQLTIENKQARSTRYYMGQSGEKAGASLASKSLIYSGVLVFAFVIWHLLSMKFGPDYTTTLDGKEVRDLYRLVEEYFQSPLNVVAYEVLMLVLGLHLSHGFYSVFQSFGLHHSTYNCLLKKLSYGFTAIVTLGFFVVPLYFLIQG